MMTLGRPTWKPSDRDREQIREMAARGIKQVDIAAIIGVSAPTLRRWCKSELTPAKPLFVPLYTQWFDAFANGTKHTEFRKHGPRWNAGTCTVGRDVVLSKGYSGPRLRASIKGISFRKTSDGEEICIHLVNIKPLRRQQ